MFSLHVFFKNVLRVKFKHRTNIYQLAFRIILEFIFHNSGTILQQMVPFIYVRHLRNNI